jgi:hypothetical protein
MTRSGLQPGNIAPSFPTAHSDAMPASNWPAGNHELGYRRPPGRRWSGPSLLVRWAAAVPGSRPRSVGTRRGGNRGGYSLMRLIVKGLDNWPA